MRYRHRLKHSEEKGHHVRFSEHAGSNGSECRACLEKGNPEAELAGDQHVAVPVRLSPIDLPLSGDAPVERHRRPRRCLERIQRAGKRPVLLDVAPHNRDRFRGMLPNSGTTTAHPSQQIRKTMGC